MTWQPISGDLVTRWTKDVTPETVWAEYPRPQMTRKDWMNLNGLWDYAITSKTHNPGMNFIGKILVPFSIESALSGVKRPLRNEDILWYRRWFSIPVTWKGKRVLLHFEAVDWEAKIYINGQLVGNHSGGYLPFWFDITEAIVEGENAILVSVWDPTDTFWQQRGKQVREPKTIWYTAASGIWQTVWLEPVPQTYITRLKITPDIDSENLSVRVFMVGADSYPSSIDISVYDAGELVIHLEADSVENEVDIPIPNPKLWSPDMPHLYDMEVMAGEDTVGAYFGMRKFSLEAGRLCLNNKPLFQYGPLDQGYWPDGLYTPPTDEAMRWDVELVKQLGCNMLRKHVKVEPARYYYYCDKQGLIVWQDMPNGGARVDEMCLFLINLVGLRPHDHNFRRAGREEVASRWDYRRELQEMVDHLHNFPCIGMWVPFNESWGQFDAKAVANWLKAYDPTRTVDHASGWFDQDGGDCKSLHIYFRKLNARITEKNRSLVLSEFGAYSLKINGHLWNPSAEFGFKKFANSRELTAAYVNLLEAELKPWVEAGLSAAIYTQTTDVEDEVNGYVTYDREVEKMDFIKVRAAHKDLLRQKY